jgi:hypothetical protein
VAWDVAEAQGFHGRLPLAARADCRQCHTEHQGRQGDILGLDPEALDHRLTDFELHGRHANVVCTACHPRDERRREAPTTCSGCHADDDVHAGRLGTGCADCHAETGWRSTRFDHGATRFPLEGTHADVGCQLCHAGERYRDTPMQCRSCHSIDDAHRGSFGDDCGRCHSPVGWKQSRFDHGKETKFALRGRHARVDCGACHTAPFSTQKLERECRSCHAADDVHRGRNGRDCASCHSTSGWERIAFDHDADTKFPLRGGHRDTACEQCHRDDPRRVKTPQDCGSCHRSDDAHEGALGEDCGSCHDARGWRQDVFFDHDLSEFPLLALHAAVSCEACHVSTRFDDASQRCVDCHRADDSHRGRLGEDCGGCHNPNGWNLWRFDHDTQTDFALEGAHASQNCLSCHTRPAGGRVTRSATCASCHGFDDAHRGGFGDDCGRCHGVDDWRSVRMP